jgi:hypothetical protein
MEPDNEIVTEGEGTDAVRQDRLWFLESMDQISRAMQGTEGLGQLSNVLETVLPIFGCDRVWLAYPCDTESRTWRMVAQQACPEFEDCTSLDLDLSMDAEIAEAIRLVAVSEVAVRFGAATSNCAYRKSHLRRTQPAHNASKSGSRSTGWFKGGSRKPSLRVADRRSCPIDQRELAQHFLRRIVARTATFRLRAARTGGEDRQLALSLPRVPVPAGVRAAVPACPWPARGAPWIRDNTA